MPETLPTSPHHAVWWATPCMVASTRHCSRLASTCKPEQAGTGSRCSMPAAGASTHQAHAQRPGTTTGQRPGTGAALAGARQGRTCQVRSSSGVSAHRSKMRVLARGPAWAGDASASPALPPCLRPSTSLSACARSREHARGADHRAQCQTRGRSAPVRVPPHAGLLRGSPARAAEGRPLWAQQAATPAACTLHALPSTGLTRMPPSPGTSLLGAACLPACAPLWAGSPDTQPGTRRRPAKHCSPRSPCTGWDLSQSTWPVSAAARSMQQRTQACSEGPRGARPAQGSRGWHARPLSRHEALGD